MGDAEWVAASRHGDHAAFGRLIERHRGLAHALARRLLDDPDEAEDVVQEAVLRAYLSLGDLRDPGRFGSWLCGIAINLARMRLRQRRAEHLSLEALAGGRRVPEEVDWPSPDPSPEQVLESRDLLRRVRAGLATLPAGQRRAVLLHYLDGLSCQEVAGLLGVSTGAVRVRLHRARAQLRELLVTGPEIPGEEIQSAMKKERRPMAEVTLHDVLVRVLAEAPAAEGGRLAGDHRVLLLRDRRGERVLPIWVGAPDGDALALQLAGRSPLRPLSADLMARLLAASGGRVERVAVSRLADEVFYATVTVAAADGTTQEVDARPSDALNLALRVGAPIVVDDGVMAQAGVAAEAVLEDIERGRRKAGASPEPERPAQWQSLTTQDAVLARYTTPPKD